MSKESATVKKMEQIRQEMEKLQEQMQKLKTGCHHNKANGRPKLEFLYEKDPNRYMKGDVRCKRCGTEFNAKPIAEEDLRLAIRTVHNAIHQIILYTVEGKDDHIVSLMGQVDHNLLKVATRYVDVILQKGKKKKKKKKKGGRIGGARYISSNGLF